MGERQSNSNPEEIVEPGILTENPEKEYEVEKALVERIENSKLGLEPKVDLILVKAGVKPASMLEVTVRNGENVFLDKEGLEDVKAILEISGLANTITSEESSKELETIKILVSQDENHLQKLKEVADMLFHPQQYPNLKDKEQWLDLQEKLGTLLGYPPTSIKGFLEENVMDRGNLPDDVQESEALAFGHFTLSKDHWTEELRQGEAWANCIKSLSPKLYAEMMKLGQENKVYWKKRKEWQKIIEDIEGTTDGLGKEIEKGIFDVVVALNALQVNTSQSCEGHLKEEGRGFPFPWVEIYAPEPEGWKTSEGNEREELEKKWKEENLKQREEMAEYLEEFYKEKEKTADERLSFEEIGIFGGFRVQSMGAEHTKSLSSDQQTEKLSLYRKEMDGFAEFLKNKFLEK